MRPTKRLAVGGFDGRVAVYETAMQRRLGKVLWSAAGFVNK